MAAAPEADMFLVDRDERVRRSQMRWLWLFSSHAQNDVRFWCSLIALNWVLFLPGFLLDADSVAYFAPVDNVGLAAGLHVLQRSVVGLLRVNVELLILAAVWVNLGNRLVRSSWPALLIVYLPLLIYQSYEGVILSLYQEEPVVLNQYYLVREGLPFLLENLGLPMRTWLGAAFITVCTAWFVFQMLRWLQDASIRRRPGKWSRRTVAALAMTTLVTTVAFQNVHADSGTVVNSTVIMIRRNLTGSIALHRAVADIKSMSIADPGPVEDDQPLIARPNIYVIFIESYGSVLYARPDFDAAYRALLAQLEAELISGGWHMASAMSESTTWGGGSWLAYTSALFGRRIDAHPQYLELLDRFGAEGAELPNLASFLKEHGYTTTWLSPLSVELADDKWEQYRNFYDIDNWMRYRDFNYVGTEYGWGPAPPDQYVLEYARENIVAAATQPVFMFFITQNSHYPWSTPPLVSDWKTLNIAPSVNPTATAADPDHQQLRMAYLGAVEYELRMLTQSILDTRDEDALFVLIGDHQPPRVSRRGDTFNTPLHIITRDSRLAQAFADHELRDGLTPPEGEAALRHEQLFPLLVDLLTGGSDDIGVGTDPLPAGAEPAALDPIAVPFQGKE